MLIIMGEHSWNVSLLDLAAMNCQCPITTAASGPPEGPRCGADEYNHSAVDSPSAAFRAEIPAVHYTIVVKISSYQSP